MRQDIFDRIMAMPFLKWLSPFYKRYKEQVLYLFFGGLTTLISICVFSLFTTVIPLDALLANVISWILAVLFAYVTNKTWVFSAAQEESGCKQMLSFYAGRLVTLVVEECILLIFIKVLYWNAMGVKIAAQVIIVLLNYVISKLFVFKK